MNFVNGEFKDSFEFARLMENHKEVNNLVGALLDFRRFLMKQYGHTQGFECLIVGFQIKDRIDA